MNKKILHLVSTRFLYLDFSLDGKIFNENYQKETAEILLNSFIKTLQNQEDQDFKCVIITNIKCKSFVSSLIFPFDVKIFTYLEFIEYIKSQLSNYDYVINTNCDYDDFFHKNNLKIIKESIKEDTTFKMFGFTNGVTLVKGEKEPHVFNPNYLGTSGFFSCCTSIIYSTKINFSNSFPYIIHDVAKKYQGAHSIWKNIIEKEYKDWGLETLDNDFFDYPKDNIYRFIWIRQPLSCTTIQLNNSDKPLHISNEIIKLDLKNDFGYDY